MTFTHALATNNYGPAKFIVDVNPANGTHTTIASALASAVSGDTIFIRPGTYTENLTLIAGVNLTAFECDALTPNVTIVGKCSFAAAGVASLSGIRLQTNGDYVIQVTGSDASIVNLFGCFIEGTDADLINLTSSSSSAEINLYYCNGNLTTTGITYFVMNSAATINLLFTELGNGGLSSTTSTIDGSGRLRTVYSNIVIPLTVSTTASLDGIYSIFISSLTNTTALTYNSTTMGSLRKCNIRSGTASCIVVGAGSTVTVRDSILESSNASAISGVGTANYDIIGLAALTQQISATLQTPRLSRYGVLASTLQPAFLATHGVLQADVTGAGVAATVNFTTEVFDQNNNYDATNTFTAPLTGRYQFNAKLFINDAATSTFALLNIVTSNRTYQGNVLTPLTTASLDQYGLVAEALADMDAADTCIVQGTVFGMAGATADYPAGGTQTYFSGYLVC